MDNHTNLSRRTSARSTVTVLALALGVLTPAAVLAGPVEDVELRCMSETPGTPDSRERAADGCRKAADVFEAAYHDCMYDAPGGADSLERWVDLCAADASAAVTSD